MTNKYKLTNINWDTDGEEVKLPKTMTVLAESEDEAIDAATDKTGWCINGATVKAVKPKPLTQTKCGRRSVDSHDTNERNTTMTKAMIEREKVKNGIRFAVHAWAPALDYGIYKPYYKTSRGAENQILKCKADDRKHGWLMDYEVVELHPYQQWFNDLPAGDAYERENNKDEARAVVYLAKLKNAMENFKAEKVEKWSDALKRKGMEFYRYRKEFRGWEIGVRKMVNR